MSFPFWQTTLNGVPQGIAKTSSESFPSPARSAATRVRRFAEPKFRPATRVPVQPTASNAEVEPSLSGEVLSGRPFRSHSAGGTCCTTPSGGRVFQVTALSDQESLARKTAWWSGSPSNANPVLLVSFRVAPVIVAPAGIPARLKRSRPLAGPVPQPYDDAAPWTSKDVSVPCATVGSEARTYVSDSGVSVMLAARALDDGTAAAQTTIASRSFRRTGQQLRFEASITRLEGLG